jgi:hypothetical protein
MTSGETPIDAGSKPEMCTPLENESYFLGVQGGIMLPSVRMVGELGGKEKVCAAALVFEWVE